MRIIGFCLLGLGIATGVSAQNEKARAWREKVDPALFAAFTRAASGETDFIILLAEQADLSGAEKLRTKVEKGTFVFQRLTETARRSQPAVVLALETQGVKFQTFWVANMIHVRGSLPLVHDMALRADVAGIFENPTVRFQQPVSEEPGPPAATEAIEPGVSLIQAPAVWSRGYTGQGIVVGGNDTGYRWTHAALKGRYRGWDGAFANHNYNWHDAIHSAVGNPCGVNNTAPCDDNGHGTHTMGTAVGADGGSNQIGVAPGAQWIGCRNMDRGVGTPATYAECLQWFIAPSDLSGNNPDPAKAPDVINNSWSCPTDENCAANTLQSAIESVRAAGIVVVVSAGNSGSGCSTVNTPPAIYDASFTIGATDMSDAMANFSSRGPVTADGSGRSKPNVTAPGVSVRSAKGTSDTAYGPLSGTSMSAPHVAGTVALILSAHPELKGKVEAVETLLEQSAVRLNWQQMCGGIAGSQIPNHTSGWGRINALAALGLDDTDGDGMEDWEELLAGTERENPLSLLRITAVNRSAADCLISFSTILNKRYRLERAAGIEPADWEAVSDNIPGTGADVQLSDPNAFAEDTGVYRVLLLL